MDDDRLIELYAGCRAVLFAPYQEDYGYVTLEAFLSRKPVITASDSGGTLEFVVDGVNGYVCDPTPDALAAAVESARAPIRRSPPRSASAATRSPRGITWDHVVDRLVGAGSRTQRVRAAEACCSEKVRAAR